MFAEEIRRAVGASPRCRLADVAALLWRAYGGGQVSEAEAEAISARIEERRAAPAAPKSLPRRLGSRPRTDASMERRRRWAASGRLPPQLAARFTLAETAVLAVVAAETAKRGDCRLCLDHVAAIAGVSRSTVKNAMRQAKRLGFVSIEERKVTGFRNDTNIVRIVSAEWQAWNRLARGPGSQEGGVKSVTGTRTEALNPGKTRPAAPSNGLPRGSGRPHRRERSGIAKGGGVGRAMP